MTIEDPLSLVGEVLDGTYRIDSLVGEGGFGVVYRAYHLGFEEPVAVKCLKIPVSLSPETRAAFLRKFREEGRLLFQLSKGTLGIVRSIALGDTTTKTGIWTPFVVLEWLAGEPLSSHLRGRRERGLCGRPLAEVMAWLDGPARSLQYAHEQRVAHRDIKPANLFVLESSHEGKPRLKVLDFGIAKVMEEGPTALKQALTHTGFTSFTPQYAAPEQFDPTLGPTGPWSDVYSFALVVVEMLTDRLCVEGSDALALMTSTLNPASRPTPRARGADVPEPVERVFSRALSIDPALRFADVGGFWDALRVTLSSTLSVHPPAHAPTPAPAPAPIPPPTNPYAMQTYSQQYAPTAVAPAPLMTPYSIPAVHAPAAIVPVAASNPFPAQPQPEQQNKPAQRSVWPWVMFGIVVGIGLVFALGALTCTTCVCVAL